MKRKIRLTESEFHSLIKRLVRETEEEMMSIEMEEPEMEDEDNESEMSQEDTVRAVADFFRKELGLMESYEIKYLKNKVVNNKTINLTEMFLREDISDRTKSAKEKAMIGGGIGMMGAGFLGMISQAMGYTDQGELMMKVHDYVEQMGGGAVSTGVLIAGLVMALKGMAKRAGH